jgi:hypothetical protein
MGVGKSYLTYFLAARAYAEGMLMLYIADAGVLNTVDVDVSALRIVERFLALNKDILTAAQLEMLVSTYNGTHSLASDAVRVIFRTFLMDKKRKTLLIVDEHGSLFRNDPSVPKKFPLLGPLSDFHVWMEDYAGSHIIFTGTAHAKYEMNVLDASYRHNSVEFVGPLSKDVFSKLLATYPHLCQQGIKERVVEVTNNVPRELRHIADHFGRQQNLVSRNALEDFIKYRAREFRMVATEYNKKLEDPSEKEKFYRGLAKTFLGNASTADFNWDFMDLGLVYRSRNKNDIPVCRILCPTAQQGLLELFKEMPKSTDDAKRFISGNMKGEQIEEALAIQLLSAIRPITFDATNLEGKNKTLISLDLTHCEIIEFPRLSLTPFHEKALQIGYEGYPRFDMILGRTFIQISKTDFANHDREGASIAKAFEPYDKKPLYNGSKNQIEYYLDEAFGTGHSAKIEKNKFVVTKDGTSVSDFRIVYIHCAPDTPTHSRLVHKYPELLLITFDEIKRKLYPNIL